MAAAVVARPQPPQAVLAAHVPDFEVQVRQRDGRDVLPDRRDRLERWGWVRGQVEGFDLREESGFAGVVEAEEEDGVFCGGRG